MRPALRVQWHSFVLSGFLALGGAQPAAADEPGKPVVGTWGIELRNLSKTLKPGDDF
jgi:hypothetical protein